MGNNREIETLYNKLDAQDKIINNQALEIARLKEELENCEQAGLTENGIATMYKERIEELEKEVELWKKKYGKL